MRRTALLLVATVAVLLLSPRPLAAYHCFIRCQDGTACGVTCGSGCECVCELGVVPEACCGFGCGLPTGGGGIERSAAFKRQIERWSESPLPEVRALAVAASRLYMAMLFQDKDEYVRAAADYHARLQELPAVAAAETSVLAAGERRKW